MQILRRLPFTLLAAWSAGMLVKAASWVTALDAEPLRWASITAVIAGGVIGWRVTREFDPWTPQDLRDGAIGWGIVGGLILALPCLALPGAWKAAAIVVLAGVITAARSVHRRADELGVPAATHPTHEPEASPQH